MKMLQEVGNTEYFEFHTIIISHNMIICFSNNLFSFQIISYHIEKVIEEHIYHQI